MMKIVIIGAGLSGLSTAIALRKYIRNSADRDLDICIYEKPDHAASGHAKERLQKRQHILGAGVGLQSNGLKVLEDLDPKLRDKVFSVGSPCDHFKWKTSGNILLGREYVDVLPVSRPLLIESLMEWLPADMIKYRSVSRVICEAGQKPRLEFNDESPAEVADLVIGADGVGSIVRKAIFRDDDRVRAVYQGSCAVGGVLNHPVPQALMSDPCMTFFLGETGSFGYAALTQQDHNKLLYWSIYETELPEKGQKFDAEQLGAALQQRHSDWSDPLIGKCLKEARIDNVYPIFVMPEVDRWGRDGCVLVGDAAHALPPRTGQGASQAFEDGQSIALLLAAYLERHDTSEAIAKTIDVFYAMRKSRVYELRSAAIKWRDPSPPFPWWQLCLYYVAVSLFTQYQNLKSRFKSVDGWNARTEVERILVEEH